MRNHQYVIYLFLFSRAFMQGCYISDKCRVRGCHHRRQRLPYGLTRLPLPHSSHQYSASRIYDTAANRQSCHYCKGIVSFFERRCCGPSEHFKKMSLLSDIYSICKLIPLPIMHAGRSVAKLMMQFAHRLRPNDRPIDRFPRKPKFYPSLDAFCDRETEWHPISNIYLRKYRCVKKVEG